VTGSTEEEPMGPEVATERADVLVIGTGGAGLRAAIAARQTGADVLVLGKRARSDAHTVLASGGINAALGTVDPQDSWQQHFADTVREGYFLSHPRVAEIMATEAPAAVLELVEWGCQFDRLPDGRLDQRYFGAHTYRRTCFSGDQTGKEIVRTLVARAEEVGVRFADHQYVSSLLVDEGECAGAFAFDLATGERTAFLAGAVVLAAGGYTSIFATNTSRAGENFGEGMALALEAGCRLMDMELVQFHPTGMVAPPEVAGTLVTEAVRGEGGLLFNAGGERFMQRYDPRRMELSTRDRVALAAYTEIMEGRGGPNGGVFLDISHRGKEYIQRKLPRMYQQLLSLQDVDISKQPMEVSPTAHYSMGGIAVEPETHATDVPRLFAAGECAAGLHGANRLGGNSLVDILVFGRRSGEAAAALAASGRNRTAASAIRRASDGLSALDHPGTVKAAEVQSALAQAMWERCGVLRDEARLGRGLERLEEIRAALADVGVDAAEGRRRAQDLARALDLRAGATTAEATLRGAIERRETRGCHNRSDFPSERADMAVNFFTTLDGDGRMEISSQLVPAAPKELREWLRDAPELDLTGRLLE
jgi:succinate dehydrogenase / fumarate reductase, flavoprotein subunit